jgi:hypothetical protein
MREAVRSVLWKGKSLQQIKTIFHWRSTKEGRNFLGRRSTKGKNKKRKGNSEVEGVGSPQGVMWMLNGGKAQEGGPIQVTKSSTKEKRQSP